MFYFQTLGGGDHFAVANDVSSMTSVRDAMKQILEKYKSPPDAVCNSAGITMDGYLVWNNFSQTFYSTIMFSVYSGDLNTGIVWWLNGQKLSDCLMVWYFEHH